MREVGDLYAGSPDRTLTPLLLATGHVLGWELRIQHSKIPHPISQIPHSVLQNTNIKLFQHNAWKGTLLRFLGLNRN